MTTVFDACDKIINKLTDLSTKMQGDEFVFPFAECGGPEHPQAVAEALKIVFANSNTGAASIVVKDGAFHIIPNSAKLQGDRARDAMDKSLSRLMVDVAKGWTVVDSGNGDELVKWPLAHEQGLPALLREFTPVRRAAKDANVPLIAIPVDNLDPMLALLGTDRGRQLG